MKSKVVYDLSYLDKIYWRISKKGKYKYILNNLIAFDIETSNGHIYNGKTYPFSSDLYISNPEIYDKGENVALMYMWQCAIETAHGECVVFIGRTYSELEKFLTGIARRTSVLVNSNRMMGAVSKNKINRDIKLNKKYVEINIFIHNLKFEFQFLRNIESFNKSAGIAKIAKNGEEYRNTFSRSRREPLKSIYENYAFENSMIVFRDTYALRNQSLSVWAKTENLESQKVAVGENYYNKIRTPLTELSDEEIKYASYDVIVMIEGLSKYIEEYGTPSDIPMTATSIVRKAAAKEVHKNKKNTENIKDCMTVYSLDFYSHLLEAFQGGYTHSNALLCNRELKGVSSYDFASAYPACMVFRKFPMGKFQELKDADKIIEFNTLDYENYAYLLKIKVKGLRSRQSMNYWSFSKVINPKNALLDNGRIIRMEEGTIVMTELDFLIFKQSYLWDEIEILRLWKSKKDYLYKELVLFILNLYKNKTNYKGLDDKKDEYKKSKQQINSMYGVTVQKIGKGHVIFDGEAWFEEYVDSEVFNKKIYDINAKDLVAPYQVGVWVTAWTRFHLWSLILKFPEKVVYTDTDSIKGLLDDKDIINIKKYNKEWIKEGEKSLLERGIDKDLMQPTTPKGVKKPLGIFDFEGKYETFKTLGAKRYFYEEDGKTEAVISGLPKKAEFDGIRDFYDGKTFDRIESFKNTASYSENQNGGAAIKWTDLKGGDYFSTDKYGICITPSTFKLSMTSEFREVIKLYGEAYITGDFSKLGLKEKIFKERI